MVLNELMKIICFFSVAAFDKRNGPKPQNVSKCSASNVAVSRLTIKSSSTYFIEFLLNCEDCPHSLPKVSFEEVSFSWLLLKMHDINDLMRNIGYTALRINSWSSIKVLKRVIMMYITIYVKNTLDQK